MKSMQFERAVWLVLGALAVVAAFLVVLNQAAGIRAPVFIHRERMVGEFGPLGLAFNEEMNKDTVQGRVKISPAVTGRMSWDGLNLWFWPLTPFQPGTTYTLTLESGSESRQGGIIRQVASWSFSARQPGLLYLSPGTESGTVWLNALDGSPARQISASGQQVADLGVSFDGQQVIYSVHNVQNGYDLWLADREGKNQRRLADCGVDWCLDPAWSPDSTRIAYRRQVVDSSNRPLGAGRLWTVDVRSGETESLYSDGRISGAGPAWSPDGHWLAFTDSASGGIRVVDLQSSRDFVMKVQLGVVGGWSLDGKTLFFADLDSGTLPSYGKAYSVTPADGQVTTLFASGPEEADYGVPVPAPGGDRIAVGLRFVGGSPSRHVMVLAPDGNHQQPVGEEELANQGAYSFSPDGLRVAFQQLRIGSSQSRPEVVVWEAATGKTEVIAQDAIHPLWVP